MIKIKRYKYAAIFSMAIAGATWSGMSLYGDDAVDAARENTRQAIDKTQDAANKGIKDTADLTRQDVNENVDAKTAMDIRSRLASIVNNAVSRNGFNDLIGSLDKPTRDRMGLERYKDFDKLNASIDQFRKDFHDKYNTDFDFKSVMLDTIPIYRGPDKDHARVLMAALESWGADNTINNSNLNTDPRVDTLNPNTKQNNDHLSNGGNQDHLVPQTTDNATGQNNTAGHTPIDTVGTANAIANSRVDANGNVAQGGLPDRTASGTGNDVTNNNANGIRPNTNGVNPYNNSNGNVANVKNAGPSDMNLITEGVVGNGWRLQASSTLSARQLGDSLSIELNALCNAKDRWPSDANQTYIKVARRVFRAIENPQPTDVTVENR